LLSERTADGQNGWYQACDRLGETASYLEDLRRAWRLAERAPPWFRHRLAAFARQCLFALVNASLNSLAGNTAPALLAEVVARQIWTPTQGLACARQIAQARQRARSLILLAPSLPPHLRADALQRSEESNPAARRARSQGPSVCGNSRTCLAHLECPREALEVARAIEQPRTRVQALAGLARHLPQPFRRQARRDPGVRDLLRAARLEERPDPDGGPEAQAALPTDVRATARLGLARRIAGSWPPEEALSINPIFFRRPRSRWPAGRFAGGRGPAAGVGPPAGGARGGGSMVRDPASRARALEALAPDLPDPLLREGPASRPGALETTTNASRPCLG